MTMWTRHRRPRSRQMVWRSRVGWTLVFAGLVLFLGGYIGAMTGLTFLPFDPMHEATQVGGAVLAIVGLPLAVGKGPGP